jgi:hypothetical protein
MSAEGVQEFGQQVISNLSAGKRGVEVFDGALEAGAIGALLGGEQAGLIKGDPAIRTGGALVGSVAGGLAGGMMPTGGPVTQRIMNIIGGGALGVGVGAMGAGTVGKNYEPYRTYDGGEGMAAGGAVVGGLAGAAFGAAKPVGKKDEAVVQ